MHLGVHPLHVPSLLRGVDPREHAPALGGRLPSNGGAQAQAANATDAAAGAVRRPAAAAALLIAPRRDGMHAAAAEAARAGAVFGREEVVVRVQPAGEQLRQWQ